MRPTLNPLAFGCSIFVDYSSPIAFLARRQLLIR
jgi:hypothetical protein